MTKQDFINAFWQNAQEACAGTPIFPILALAEAAVESGWGGSQLTQQANNLFGVKAYPDWTGKTITMPTKEYHPDGTPYYIDAPFKAYDSPTDSFADYVKVVTGPRYAARGTLNAPDAATQINEIAAAGYSTSPTYASLVTSVMDGLQPLLA